ncbi:ATP-binding protein [Methanosarcina sp. KYL-1]|uniref:ATP-binding protein n=1 Tax=Methanosarcina sp. KYL-1 TaxID=2602068 RepID=UPI002100D0C3|nr:ATP-binding protein [Methanosarcina sp. KYL-1]MCQ1536416.1 ATP-binding protein [Methanosarcina sp. KYL-1]
MNFYSREKELELMDLLYGSRPSFLVITGKRRVGKTELIRQFMKQFTEQAGKGGKEGKGRQAENEGKAGKNEKDEKDEKNEKAGKEGNALYFFVDSNKSIGLLMEEFGQVLKSGLGLPDYIKVDEPEAFLEFLTSYEGDLVVAIDEFQRFQKIYPSFISQLQRYWDLKPEKSRLFLVVSGSSVGMIKKIFIEDKAPLFKRADNILTLKPFGVREVFAMLEDLGVRDSEEKLKLYFLFGGTVYYYRLFEKYGCRSFEDALEKLIFSDFAPLRDEVRDVLIEEFGKEHATYYEIISAVARGKASQSEISDLTHVSPNSLGNYFYDLIDLLGVLEYRIPVPEKPGRSKKGRYFLKDNFFRFYGYFIYPRLSQYMAGNYGLLLDKVRQEWSSYTGLLFEALMRDLITAELAGEYPEIGPWWDRRGNEIDLVGLSPGTGKGKGNGSNTGLYPGPETGKVLLVEIKDRELSEKDARKVLSSTLEKAKYIPGCRDMQIEVGIAARKIGGRKKLEDEGFRTWELRDFTLSL